MSDVFLHHVRRPSVVRSAKALQLLLDSGFSNACHVQGGINAWSREIDPSVPLY